MTFVLQVGITFAHVALLLVIAVVPVLVSYGIWTCISYLLSKLQMAAQLAFYFAILAMIIGGTSRGYDMALDLAKQEAIQRTLDVDKMWEMAINPNSRSNSPLPCTHILREENGGKDEFRRCASLVWDFCYYHQRNKLVLDPQPFEILQNEANENKKGPSGTASGTPIALDFYRSIHQTLLWVYDLVEPIRRFVRHRLVTAKVVVSNLK